MNPEDGLLEEYDFAAMGNGVRGKYAKQYHEDAKLVMNDLSKVSDTELVLEIYRRIKGESEMHYHLNYLYRAALRPVYTFFDKQNIDEANIRSYQLPNWELLEAERDEVLAYFPDDDEVN